MLVMGQVREMKVCGRDYELTTFVDEEDYWRLRLWEYKWHRHVDKNTTYVRACKKRKTVLLHRLVLGLLDSPTALQVDHRDHNGLNNSKSNLRITDNGGNSRNKTKRSRKTSSHYKGVSRRKDTLSKPWVAYISAFGKRKHLGFFRTEKEAAQAYNSAALELSDFYELNRFDCSV